MKKTHRGSCHCGAVAFECDADLAQGTSRCNCSICTKSRFWKALVPAAAFRLLKGADAITEYRFGSNAIAHRFCANCGVKVFGSVHLDFDEMKGEFYAINVAALDDVTPEELDGLPVEYQDGMQDRWDRAPAVLHYL